MTSISRVLAATAALACAARVGATMGVEVVPTISVVDPAVAPATAEMPVVKLNVPRTPSQMPAPRFAVSTMAPGENGFIQFVATRRVDASAVDFRMSADRNTPPPAPAEVQSPSGPKESSVSFSVPRYHATLLERETVAACLVLEAASQGEFGMRAVMAVIRNRAHCLPELFASTVLAAKQFSAFNRLTAGLESLATVISRARRDRTWPLALAIVDRALDEAWDDPTDGATHYTRTGERTRWTRSLAKTTTIGAHSFYR